MKKSFILTAIIATVVVVLTSCGGSQPVYSNRGVDPNRQDCCPEIPRNEPPRIPQAQPACGGCQIQQYQQYPQRKYHKHKRKCYNRYGQLICGYY